MPRSILSERGDAPRSPRPGESPRLTPRRRFAFAVATLAIAIVALEVALQLFYLATVGDLLLRRTTAPIFVADEIRGYRVQSNLAYVHRSNEFRTRIYTNSLGNRTGPARETPPVEKAADEYRVLFLGPSFAFGWGSENEDIYAVRIAEGLRVPGKRVLPINLGTPAQAPGPQLCWLEQEGYRYRPDLVVVTSYGEDVASLPSGCPESIVRPVIEGGRLYTTTPTLAKRVRATLKNSALVFYAYYAYRAVLPASAGQDRPEIGKELYGGEDSERSRTDRGDLVARYRGLEDFVKRQVGERTKVAFLHIPLSFVAHAEDASRWQHITDVNAAEARRRTGQSVASLRAAGVQIVDTSDALRRAANGERMYYWLDIHLTPAGNRVVADAVLPLLQELAVAPGRDG